MYDFGGHHIHPTVQILILRDPNGIKHPVREGMKETGSSTHTAMPWGVLQVGGPGSWELRQKG